MQDVTIQNVLKYSPTTLIMPSSLYINTGNLSLKNQIEIEN